ncbi:hypothetical protein NMG60_11030797 [Bertholletia excelsa]
MVRPISKEVTAMEYQEAESPIQGDTLAVILSHVPMIDLVPASHVSATWRRAVFSSLRHLNRPKTWLIVHTQATRSPYTTTTHAYDHRSDLWIEIGQPPIKYVSALRFSHSNLLYMLSPARLSFSFDPLHLTWHHVAAPLVWRSDPIVAAVGRQLVVAGGTCDFEDDPLAVEIFDLESGKWDSCESMPALLKDSSASTWLSIASNDRNLFVTEKSSGVTHTFDPETKTWLGPYDLRPDPCVFCSTISFSEDRLILIGLTGDMDNVSELKLWEVNRESFDCEELGEMPRELLKKLRGETLQLSSIGVCSAGDIVHVYNPSMADEVFVCEIANGSCTWRSITNWVAIDRNPMERLVFSCSNVELDVVHEALKSGDRKFTPLQ